MSINAFQYGDYVALPDGAVGHICGDNCDGSVQWVRLLDGEDVPVPASALAPITRHDPTFLNVGDRVTLHDRPERGTVTGLERAKALVHWDDSALATMHSFRDISPLLGRELRRPVTPMTVGVDYSACTVVKTGGGKPTEVQSVAFCAGGGGGGGGALVQNAPKAPSQTIEVDGLQRAVFHRRQWANAERLAEGRGVEEVRRILGIMERRARTLGSGELALAWLEAREEAIWLLSDMLAQELRVAGVTPG